jgi:hypothetical protein
MEIRSSFIPCSKCPIRLTEELNLAILEDFIHDSLLMSMSHYSVIEQILPQSERNKYYFKHAQAELLLSILRRLEMTR